MRRPIFSQADLQAIHESRAAAGGAPDLEPCPRCGEDRYPGEPCQGCLKVRLFPGRTNSEPPKDEAA